MAEAATVNRIDYSRVEYHDDLTVTRLYHALCEAGVEKEIAAHAIEVLQSQGFLFRERKAS